MIFILDVDECQSTNSIVGDLGKCVNALTCENFPGSFECTCADGWDGPLCDNNIDDCDNQCKNQATCVDLINNYHCACSSGFTGQYCETNINECANSPCQNGKLI